MKTVGAFGSWWGETPPYGAYGHLRRSRRTKSQTANRMATALDPLMMNGTERNIPMAWLISPAGWSSDDRAKAIKSPPNPNCTKAMIHNQGPQKRTGRKIAMTQLKIVKPSAKTTMNITSGSKGGSKALSITGTPTPARPAGFRPGCPSLRRTPRPESSAAPGNGSRCRKRRRSAGSGCVSMPPRGRGW